MDLVELEKNSQLIRHPWETARINVIADKIKQLLGAKLDSDEQINILDVGSGDAYVIDQLAHRFPSLNFIGIDIYYTQEQIKLIKEKILTSNRVQLFNSWDALHLANTKISLVLLLDVIEHVEDDTALIEQINAHLPYAFEFIITVPAYQSLFTQHDVFLVHYRRYNNVLLTQNVTKGHWTPTETGYFFVIPLLARILSKLREVFVKERQTADGIAAWNKGKTFTEIVVGILWVDYLFCKTMLNLGIKIPGLSNIMLGARVLK